MLSYDVLCELAENGYVSGQLRTKIEKGVATTPSMAYWYARHVLHGPFKLGEAAIAKDGVVSCYYAKRVLHGPFPLGEFAIAMHPSFWREYAQACLHLSMHTEVEAAREAVLTKAREELELQISLARNNLG